MLLREGGVTERAECEMAPRAWGWWTEHKLEILSKYLQAFTTASKNRASERIYLDLFAGVPDNVGRELGHSIEGSALRALAVDPPFTRLRYCELRSNAGRLEQDLRSRFPGRDIRVYPGDCNDTVGQMLADLAGVRWAPTFAFVDQQSVELRWSTLERLARFKPPERRKPELWLLFASGLFPRGLQVRQELMDASFADRLTAMLGTQVWTEALAALREGLLSPADFEDELRNLMRWQLERRLGYKQTHAFTMMNTGGRHLYDMIFATDHDAGHRIMGHLYGKAAHDHPEMRQQALAIRRQRREEEKHGIQALIDITEVPIRTPRIRDDALYEHVPPRPPYQLPEPSS